MKKFKYTLIFTILTVLILFNIVYASDVEDVKNGTVVNSYSQYISTIEKATKTLQPSVNLIVNGFNSNDYKLRNLDLKGIQKIKCTGETQNGVANLTTYIEYSQWFKIQQALANDIAFDRLNVEDRIVLSKAKQIINDLIDKDMSDYEKELAIHDYIVLNCEYDYINYLNNLIPPESYTIYGLLIDGKGVCQAYTDATKLLLNMAGVECEIVEGNDNHTWNIVKLDKQYYMLDVTWDDPYPDQKGKVSYDYFNVTSEKMSELHSWDISKYPDASATEYNYYIYNNMVVNNYEEFKNYVIKNIRQNKKEISVYINGYDKDEYKMEFIFDYYKGNVSYSIPQSQNSSMRIVLN